MNLDDRPAHGQWVFRNNRWYFLPRDASFVEPIPGSVDKEALASLVDPSELIRILKPAVAVSGLPIVVYFLAGRTDVEEWDRTNPDVAVGYPERFMPTWYQEVVGVHDGIQAFFQESLEAAAQNAVIQGKGTALDTLLGPRSFQAELIGFTHHGKSIIHGAVSMLTVGSDSLPAASDFRQQTEVPEVEWDSALNTLARVLPPQEFVEKFVDMVKLNVIGYAARVQEAFTYRMELAAEQARAMHYFVRAETLEKRMLSSTSELDRATRSTGVVVEELDTILELPGLGIVIEDTDHLVRYLNPMMADQFGQAVGRKCYEALKGKEEPCEPCVIDQIWKEGKATVNYLTTDPRTLRTYHILSAPLVSRTGERLVIEAGIDVTQLVQKQRSLQARVDTLQLRNQQLLRIGDTIRSTLLDACHEMGRGIMDSTVNQRRLGGARNRQDEAESREIQEALDSTTASLTTCLGRLSDIAVALSIDETPRSTDVESMVRAIMAEEQQVQQGRLDVQIAVMPRVLTTPAILDRLIRALLLRFLAPCTGDLTLNISHTMSGTGDSIRAGDNYHVLSFTGPRPTDEYVELVTLTQLLSLRLGGTTWTAPEGARQETCFLTIPLSPP